MSNHGFIPGEVLAPDERCQVILRIYGEDKQCPRRAISNGRCKRHGGEVTTPELITHKETT